MSESRRSSVTCCPCGLFKVQGRGESTSAEKYRMTSDNVSKDDVRNHDDEDGDKFIVPYEDDVVATSHDETLKQEYEEDIEDFKSKFQDVADKDGEVNAWQLQDILNKLFSDVAEDGFSLDICRGMVASCDNNLSGQMSYQEAAILYKQLSKWKHVFRSLDDDHTGSIASDKLDDVVRSLGYEVSSRTIKVMTVRYSNKDNRMSFADFVSCLLKFSTFCDAYKQKQVGNDPSFTADEFIQLTMYS